MCEKIKKKTIHLCLQKKVLYGSAIQIRQDSLINYIQNAPEDILSQFVFEATTVVPNKSKNLLIRFFSELWIGISYFTTLFFSNAALFFVSSPNYLTSLLISVFVLKIRKRKLVYEIRDLYPKVLSEKTILDEDGVIYRSLNGINKYILPKCELIITTSPSLKHFILQNYSVSSERVKVVYNGAVQKNLSTVQKRPANKRFTIICVGNFGQFQSVELITKLAKKLSKHDIDILVVGRVKVPKNLEKTSNLKFIPPLFGSEIEELLANADVGLSARDQTFISRNSMPMKIYEYLSFGLPLLIFPKSEAGEFSQKLRCGMDFDLNQLDSACEYVLKLKSSNKELVELSNNALNASRLFDRDKETKRLVDLLIKYVES